MIKRIIGLFLILAFVTTLGGGCTLEDPAKDPRRPITLDYWRPHDDRDDFAEIIKEYTKKHPNVTINYRKIKPEDYREELLDAMAEDRGPDIFSVNNTWMKEYQDKISPMPSEVTMSRLEEKGTIKKETVQKEVTKETMSLKELENTFVDVVYDDMVLTNPDEEEKKIYGLPLSVDTLAMYYNKDLFNNAGVADPPEYWDREFQDAVKKMTKQDSDGEITQSGVAMGGSDNIENSVDILSVLMMQNRAEMMTDNGNVMFNQSSEDSDGYNPGREALRFYTDFANPAKEVYCWNDEMNNSLKRFTEGKLGIMFGYSYHLPIIKSQAPKLNFNIAQLPQINNSARQTNYANYWGEVVSKKSDSKDAAWDFIMFATQKEQAQKYLEETNKPTALRSLIEEQKEDNEIGVFAEQLLTAASWYEGHDAPAMERAMKDMMDEALKDTKEIKGVIGRGVDKVRQTVER